MLAPVIAFSVQVTPEVRKGSQACFTGFSVTVVDPFMLSCLWEDNAANYRFVSFTPFKILHA